MVKEKFLEFIGGFTFPDTNAYGEKAIPTPVGRSDKLAMLIHYITVSHDTLDAAVDGDEINMQLNRSTGTVIRKISDPTNIESWTEEIMFTTSGQAVKKRTLRRNYDPPILYAKSNIFFASQTSGQTGAVRCDTKIAYTIQKVDATTFLEALVD